MVTIHLPFSLVSCVGNEKMVAVFNDYLKLRTNLPFHRRWKFLFENNQVFFNKLAAEVPKDTKKGPKPSYWEVSKLITLVFVFGKK